MARTKVKRVVVDVKWCECADDLLQTGKNCTGMTRRDCNKCVFGGRLLPKGKQFSLGDTLVLYSDGTVELIKKEAQDENK